MNDQPRDGGTSFAPTVLRRGLSQVFTVEIEREEDGRWIAEVPALPGVLATGKTRDEALASAQALALRVLADRLEHGEADGGPLAVSFFPCSASSE